MKDIRLKIILGTLLSICLTFGNIFKVFAATDVPTGEDYIGFYSLNTGEEDYVPSIIYDDLVQYAIDSNVLHITEQNTLSKPLFSISSSSRFGAFYTTNGFDILSDLPNLTLGYNYNGGTDYTIGSDFTDTVVLMDNTSLSAHIIRFNGSNGAVVSHNGQLYYVSDTAFDYYCSIVNYVNGGWVYSFTYQYPNGIVPRNGSISSTSNGWNDHYLFTIPQDICNYSVRPLLQFTNCPIYLSDDETGATFTPETYTSNGGYTDINYIRHNGTFPEEGGDVVANPASDKYNLSFRMSNVFCGSLTNIWHYIGNLRFNSYIEDHPERFWFCGAYIIQYQDDHMATPKTFYYGGTDIVDSLVFSKNIGLMAYRNSGDVNGDLPNDWAFGLTLSQFQDENGTSLVNYITATMNRVTGQNTTTINLDEQLMINPVSWIQSEIFGEKPVLTEVEPLYESSIVKFKLTSDVWISTQDPLNTTGNGDGYDSNHNIATYDFLSGVSKTESSDNVYEPNSPPASGEEDGEQIITGNLPSKSSGGGTTNYGGPVAKIEKGAITIQNGPQNELVVDVGALQSFKSIIETLKTEIVDQSNDNSFIAVIKDNYELFPAPILSILIIGACVTVFAGFIKVVTRR